MGQVIRIGVEVDRETDMEIERWSQEEGRSKRRHTAILVRRLTNLRKTHRQDLERLGLVQPSLGATVGI